MPLVYRSAVLACLSAISLGTQPSSPTTPQQQGVRLCEAVGERLQQLGAPGYRCPTAAWQVYSRSPMGHPLTYTVIGSPTAQRTHLVLSGVHPDELTPIPMAYQLLEAFRRASADRSSSDVRLVIAPLVNPDGLLGPVVRRTNARGVDLNRNFPTANWHREAYRHWQTRSAANPRYAMGAQPASEVETRFQMHLIETYRPDAIVSLHSPLGLIDFDGCAKKPASGSSILEEARELAEALFHDSGYPVSKLSAMPGSLGTYAGIDLKIPTLTVELPTTDLRQSERLWTRFGPGLVSFARESEP